MAEMTDKLSVMLGPAEAKWLYDEAKRINRPKSFVVRKLILRETLNRSVDATESVETLYARGESHVENVGRICRGHSGRAGRPARAGDCRGGHCAGSGRCRALALRDARRRGGSRAGCAAGRGDAAA